MFKQMLYVDALRGWDSTGILAIGGDDSVTIVKDAVTPARLFQINPDWKWTLQKRALVGHNRSATRGALNANNAHPFKEKHISLVHNGTLVTHRGMKNVDVDSLAITHSIADIGAIPTLEKLDGAFALIWFNEETKQLYCTRNEERPLFIIETEDCYFIASEKELVHWICVRNKDKIKKSTPCTPGTLYTFTETKENQIVFQQQKYKLLKKAPVVYRNNVQQIKPAKQVLPKEDINVGDVVQLLCYHAQHTQYNNYNIGKIKWSVEAPQYPDIHAEMYTNDTRDFSEEVVNAIVEKVFFSGLLERQIVIFKNPELEPSHNTLVKKITPPQPPDENNATLISTRNGIKLTKEVLDIAKDSNCLFCSEPFVASKGIHLMPVIRHNRIYKYHYHCPDCAEICTPGSHYTQTQVGAMH